MLACRVHGGSGDSNGRNQTMTDTCSVCRFLFLSLSILKGGPVGLYERMQRVLNYELFLQKKDNAIRPSLSVQHQWHSNGQIYVNAGENHWKATMVGQCFKPCAWMQYYNAVAHKIHCMCESIESIARRLF